MLMLLCAANVVFDPGVILIGQEAKGSVAGQYPEGG